MQIETSQRAKISAVLGPTNTGKTYLALERMMGYSSGMIGFPLRLLARENYDRVVKAKGAGAVALITGEEKILPPHARYFLCTVESMPVEREVDFLGVDEIQMASDPERGHIFTDRLLNARGRQETMFMGSETIARLLRALVPDLYIENRPRFSKLTWAGSKKITRLPNRSAIVAFSASEVYAIAELIRRQKGGAAVVMGALSPRTRNAQVDLYQEGEVDYIVATDAIGMGLNMDVDHVAFAALSKFDGRAMRGLTAQETAQIAGRAGRFMKDGTFGVTADCPPMDVEMIERLEGHEFDPVERLYWRNSRLRFTSLETLMDDLKKRPESRALVRPSLPEDERTLEFLARDHDIAEKAKGPRAIKLLWEVCQVPDFSKTLSDAHPRLMGQIFTHLCHHKRVLPTDWVAGHVQRLDRRDGDIDQLTGRLAAIRTWTYISQRAQWLGDPKHWQEITRRIEDKISDALHEQLTKRFVDRRTSVLMKKLKGEETLLAGVSPSGDVIVEGHYVGHLQGFQFQSVEADGVNAKRAVSAAASKVLRQAMDSRLQAFEKEEDQAFSLSESGWILWQDHPIARLRKGADILHPLIEVRQSDLLEDHQSKRIHRRLDEFIKKHFRKELKALFRLQKLEGTGALGGVAFQLVEGLGSLQKNRVQNMLTGLEKDERYRLRQSGVEIGRSYVFCPNLLKERPVYLRGVLYGIFHDPGVRLPAGRMSFDKPEGVEDAFFEACGYGVFDRFCLRHDMLERILELAWTQTKKGRVEISGDFTSLAGCSKAQMALILKKCGYAILEEGETIMVQRKKSQMKKKTTKAKKNARKFNPDPDSPFAILGKLKT